MEKAFFAGKAHEEGLFSSFFRLSGPFKEHLLNSSLN